MSQRRLTNAAAGPIYCATYSRVANATQGEEHTSIGMQREACRRLAAERGWKIYDEYVDLGASGRTAKGRPQFSAMMQKALEPDPPFTEILVSDDSRFYRDDGASQIARVKLALNGVHVHSVRQPTEEERIAFERVRQLLERTFGSSVDSPRNDQE
jgi:DNA invertase Pin-like site-specific DNA recombinase